jgi:hypothetical protein
MHEPSSRAGREHRALGRLLHGRLGPRPAAHRPHMEPPDEPANEDFPWMHPRHRSPVSLASPLSAPECNLTR